MQLNPLTAICPIDGRYHGKTAPYASYFSEYALIRYRLQVEVRYLRALVERGLPQLEGLDSKALDALDTKMASFDEATAESVKQKERVTNHDVKAVEYQVKEWMAELDLSDYSEFVHFGLTSQDINNTATPWMIMDAVQKVYLPSLGDILSILKDQSAEWADVPMLARTHGQPASPTRLGKEWRVFIERLELQCEALKAVPFKAKFGGATGNFNAHHVAYPDIDWPGFADGFVASLGLERSHTTTQIEHYDHMAMLFQTMARIHTILIDLCRDIWTYISIDYFKQKVVAGEVGSSAMPHKVNPIDFENAEGNLGMANSICQHLAADLPVSRLQRDLTDSTVARNIGLPFAYAEIAFKSISKGLGKLQLNPDKLDADLEANWAVVAEAIQTILRRDGYPEPYEALKALTRGAERIDKDAIHAFIDSLDVTSLQKDELKQISPSNYLGVG